MQGPPLGDTPTPTMSGFRAVQPQLSVSDPGRRHRDDSERRKLRTEHWVPYDNTHLAATAGYAHEPDEFDLVPPVTTGHHEPMSFTMPPPAFLTTPIDDDDCEEVVIETRTTCSRLLRDVISAEKAARERQRRQRDVIVVSDTVESDATDDDVVLDAS
ncbi:Uncharacterized protein PBTT_05768 [Plasmodiophora brassicae]|uniref:Uncharacterized protein n=1 Tax=Plasmodiophora brassicae TaxID=37360 RepID=A0A0G4IXV3_PLABS|nr:hypothetical protein PBRA_007882 [Plasmodiophora brassicae]SPQ98954.1 unnamed protein product [Plasmodiophora brassicae]